MIELIFVLIIIGVGLWLLNTYVPMAPPIKTIINVLVILLVLYWIVSSLGLIHGAPLHRLR